MKRIFIGLFVHILMAPLAIAEWVDEANHEAIFIEMEDTTKLEVLDWGGDNKPTLFLLAGMPLNAHTYDEFAAHFTGDFRVVALTRIGHGNSEPPKMVTFLSRGWRRTLLAHWTVWTLKKLFLQATHLQALSSLIWVSIFQSA